MNNPIRLATVGTGYFSRFHYDAWSRQSSVEVTGVCNRHLEPAQTIAKSFQSATAYDDFRVMLETEQPDWVDIITPPQTHLAFVTTCAELGVNAIVQKPFGETLAQAKQMVELAENVGIEIVVHENFRFMPWFRQIKAILDEGRLGKVLNARFDLRPGDGQGPEAYLERQPYFQTMERFLIHETAIHLVDTFRYLFGEVRSVYADLRRCNPAIRGEDAGLIVFNLNEDLRAVFDGNRLLDHAAENCRTTMGEFRVEGTEGSIRLDGDARIWWRSFGESEETEVRYDWSNQNFGGDCVFHLIDHIVKKWVGDRPLENTAREYLKNIEIEEAIYQSAMHHRMEVCHGMG